MPANDNKGLGDFGLVTPSQGTNAADQLGGLKDILGSDLISEAEKSKMLTQQIGQLQGQDSSGFLERLLDPGVLLSILGGGVAAAAGAPIVGAGLGIGGLQRHQLLGAVEDQQRAKGIEELKDERDKADKSVEKMRGRIERMLVANSELFVGPGGEVPDPDVLGYLVTGADLPVFPQTRRVESRRDKQWDAKFKFLSGALEQAELPQDKAAIIPHMLELLEWKDAPQGLVENLAFSLGTPQWDQAWASTLFRYGGETALNALVFAGENGLSLQDPQVLRMIQFTGDDALQPSQVINQRVLDLIAEMNEWQKQNPEQALTIQDSAQNKAEEIKLMTEAAFAGRTADQALFLDKQNVPTGMDMSTLLRAYSMADKNLGLLNLVAQANNFDDLSKLSQQELENYKMNTGMNIISGAINVAAQSVAKQQAALRNRKMVEVGKALPNANDETIRIILNITMEGARERAKKTPDGLIDVADWERHIDSLLPEVLKVYQTEQKNLRK